MPKRDVVTGEWRKLHIEELNDLYTSLNIVLVIKSRSAYTEEERRIQGFGGDTGGKDTTWEKTKT